MKTLTAWTLCAALTVASGLAFSQDPPAPESTEKRVERLEKELVAMRKLVEDLAKTSKAQSDALDAVIVYLNTQAESSKEVQKALDASETAGFVYGINPRSREILLAAWREQLTKMQAGLPEPPKEPEPVKPAPTDKLRRPVTPRD